MSLTVTAGRLLKPYSGLGLPLLDYVGDDDKSARLLLFNCEVQRSMLFMANTSLSLALWCRLLKNVFILGLYIRMHHGIFCDMLRGFQES